MESPNQTNGNVAVNVPQPAMPQQDIVTEADRANVAAALKWFGEQQHPLTMVEDPKGMDFVKKDNGWLYHHKGLMTNPVLLGRILDFTAICDDGGNGLVECLRKNCFAAISLYVPSGCGKTASVLALSDEDYYVIPFFCAGSENSELSDPNYAAMRADLGQHIQKPRGSAADAAKIRAENERYTKKRFEADLLARLLFTLHCKQGGWTRRQCLLGLISKQGCALVKLLVAHVLATYTAEQVAGMINCILASGDDALLPPTSNKAISVVAAFDDAQVPAKEFTESFTPMLTKGLLSGMVESLRRFMRAETECPLGIVTCGVLLSKTLPATKKSEEKESEGTVFNLFEPPVLQGAFTKEITKLVKLANPKVTRDIVCDLGGRPRWMMGAASMMVYEEDANKSPQQLVTYACNRALGIITENCVSRLKNALKGHKIVDFLKKTRSLTYLSAKSRFGPPDAPVDLIMDGGICVAADEVPDDGSNPKVLKIADLLSISVIEYYVKLAEPKDYGGEENILKNVTMESLIANFNAAMRDVGIGPN